MKYRVIALALALVVPMLAQHGTQNAAVGTWKQLLSKSKYSPGPAPTIPTTVKIESVEGGEKVSVDGVGADGKATSYAYTVKYGGTPTSVTGSPYGDMVAFKKRNDREVAQTYTRNGNVSRTSMRTVSKDGKTLTIAAKGTTANGQKYDNVTLFEKQ